MKMIFGRGAPVYKVEGASIKATVIRLIAKKKILGVFTICLLSRLSFSR
jgi:hypothetical protein